MATLPQITLHFNRSIKLSNDGGALSSDTGNLVFREFDEKLGFSQTIAKYLQLPDTRSYALYANEDLFRQKFYQLLAGYPQDDAADFLTKDPVFTHVLGMEKLASQPSLSRFFGRFDHATVERLHQANQELLDRMYRHREPAAMIVDLDSTLAETHGKQEQSEFNSHYKAVGYHPLVAFDGLTGDCLKAELRPGNVYTSNGVVDFVKPLLAHYNQHFPGMIPFVRADSGFAVPGLYELCEALYVWYVIALKTNAVLLRLAEEYHPSIHTP